MSKFLFVYFASFLPIWQKIDLGALKIPIRQLLKLCSHNVEVEEMTIQPKEWTLLAISSAKGRPLSPVQLQKTLFLLEKNWSGDLGEYYSFRPYNYGPFDASIYRDAEALAEMGLIAINRLPGRAWSEYAVTPAGLKFAEELQKQAPKSAVDFLERVVDWVLKLKFEELIKVIYKHYPEFRINSVFRS